MNKVLHSNSIPDGSIIDRNLSGTIDYLDSFSIKMIDDDHHSIDYLTAVLFSSLPGWVRGLLKLRDALVRPFGLLTGSIASQAPIGKSVYFATGDRAIFFSVIDRTDSEIVMSEDDKHLYFRTSLYIDKIKGGQWKILHLTTLVQFHNRLGKLYFLPVKPFHKVIMKTLLQQLAKTIDRDLFFQEELCKPT